MISRKEIVVGDRNMNTYSPRIASRTAVIAVSVLLMLLVASSILIIKQAQASTEGGVIGALQGPNVKHRSTIGLIPFEQSEMRVMRGTKDANGNCRFSGSRLYAPPGDNRIRAERLVAVNPDTCEYQVERGIVSHLPGDPPGETHAYHGNESEGR
ncbi:exported hypothetical protein [Nitrolancea hollandica Lb]|uniref:Uncharacterized protein n=2 Tax=Nitrolancea hollandica TaxID=1206749 RepID=I4EDR9_9BACT|nr:exported hypothetical protein [Nitrolancea hollandica Lb]